MYTGKKQESKNGTAANNGSIRHQRNNTEALQLHNNRPQLIVHRELQEAANNSQQVQQFRNLQAMVNNSTQVKQLKALQLLANENAHDTNQSNQINNKKTIQRYSYQRGTNQSVTLKSQKTNNKSITFDVCTYNQVHYDKGDKKQSGSGTGTADWKGWLIDNGTNNNATQLHVVNMEWGGLGGAKDGNIAPGSQALNGKHKSPEGMYKSLFNSSNIATADITYKCAFGKNEVLGYNGQTIGNDVAINDPDIYCSISADDKLGNTFGEDWVVIGSHAKGMIVRDGG